jgi:hypothetical protein
MSTKLSDRDERALTKFTRLRYGGDISKLDAEGKSLLWRSGDLAARLLLNDMTLPEFEAKNFRWSFGHGSCRALSG